ncbi:MAG: hypothetical protein QXN24_06970 [Candidatus Bathyarchaeia archaeon]
MDAIKINRINSAIPLNSGISRPLKVIESLSTGVESFANLNCAYG